MKLTEHWKTFSFHFQPIENQWTKLQAEFDVETLCDVQCFHFQLMLSYVKRNINKFPLKIFRRNQTANEDWFMDVRKKLACMKNIRWSNPSINLYIISLRLNVLNYCSIKKTQNLFQWFFRNKISLEQREIWQFS